MSIFEKSDNIAQIFLTMAILDGVILLAGVYQYLQTNNLLWIVGAVVLSSVLIVIPAIMRAGASEVESSKDEGDD
jgi:hypothetical protein